MSVPELQVVTFGMLLVTTFAGAITAIVVFLRWLYGIKAVTPDLIEELQYDGHIPPQIEECMNHMSGLRGIRTKKKEERL